MTDKDKARKDKATEATEKAASERGDVEKAERHYEKAQKWQDRMNELLGDSWPTY